MMFKWIKKLKSIVASYDADLRKAHARIDELEKLVRDRTNIAVDVGFKSANHVIVIGRYKNADYIQTYTLDTPNLSTLIERLRHMDRAGVVRRVDAPPQFRAVFERDARKDWM
jgi:hypothetical protein